MLFKPKSLSANFTVGSAPRCIFFDHPVHIHACYQSFFLDCCVVSSSMMDARIYALVGVSPSESAFFFLSSFHTFLYSANNFLNIPEGGSGPQISVGIRKYGGHHSVAVELIFFKRILIIKECHNCAESVSNFLPISEARFSFVRILVMTRLTGDCFPLRSILASSKRLVPFFTSYLPGT